MFTKIANKIVPPKAAKNIFPLAEEFCRLRVIVLAFFVIDNCCCSDREYDSVKLSFGH
jgi:hypothetical protein